MSPDVETGESAVRRQIRDCAATIAGLEAQAGVIAAMGATVVACLKAGGKVLSAGNGGSAAEALHMAEELVGRFRRNRRSLPAIALAADATALTCIGNDFGFDQVFSRQVEGLGQRGDVLVLFTSSGNSENLVRAAAAGKARGLTVLGLLGRGGGRLAGVCTQEIIVPGTGAERVQEAHQLIMHLILDAVEAAFPESGAA